MIDWFFSAIMRNWRSRLGPNIVYVLPEPVWPYANIVQLNPCKRFGMQSPTKSKMSTCLELRPKTLS